MNYNYYSMPFLKKQTYYPNELYVSKIVKIKSKSEFDVIKVGIFAKLENNEFLNITTGIVFKPFNENSQKCEYYVLEENSKCLSDIIVDDYVRKVGMSFEAVEWLEKDFNQKIYSKKTSLEK